MIILLNNIAVSILLIFVFSNNTFAITPIPTSSFTIPVPNLNCGDANSKDPVMIKCCKTSINSPDLITKQFLSQVPSFGTAIVNLIAPLINKTSSITTFTQTEVEQKPCVSGSPSTPGDTNNDSCICISAPTGTPFNTLKPICSNMSSSTNEKSQCEACVGNGGYWSALGCFSGNVSEFIADKILGTGVGIEGGISLLCIMFAAFQMQTSSGNAEKIKKAQELLTNCITGLMVIIFSVLILKIIGVDILKIPNFN